MGFKEKNNILAFFTAKEVDQGKKKGGEIKMLLTAPTELKSG